MESFSGRESIFHREPKTDIIRVKNGNEIQHRKPVLLRSGGRF